MKSRVMINKNDGPMFEKGDIVTIQVEGGSFGSSIDNNSKFKTLTIDGLSIDDVEILKQPLAIYEDSAELYEVIKHRKFYTDVDNILVNEMPADDFMNLLSIKTVDKDIQTEDVIV